MLKNNDQAHEKFDNIDLICKIAKVEHQIKEKRHELEQLKKQLADNGNVTKE